MSKAFAAILLLLGLLSVSLAQIDLSFVNSNYKGYTFNQFKKDFKRKYSSQNEESFRRGIFEKNLELVKQHNENPEYTYQLGINQFSDVTQDEFKQTHSNYKSSKVFVESPVIKSQPIAVPASIDWVRAGKVTAVKNQTSCGACYAFSAAAAIESAYLIHHNIYYNLSEQHIISCSDILGNNKCKGGNAEVAFEYIKQYGVKTADEKPYEEGNGTCEQRQGRVKIHDYVFAQGCDELEKGLSLNPVTVEIEIHKVNFVAYRSGIYTGCPECEGGIQHHGVLAVGMTKQYWKIKNSWGNDWGEGGFMRLTRGNTCKICEFISYPILK